MTNGIEYKTKQRADLVAFLETVKGEHLTAKTICELLDKSGVRMGSATVYRHLERLVGEGLMLKYSMGSNGAACFEYVGPEGQCCTPIVSTASARRAGGSSTSNALIWRKSAGICWSPMVSPSIPCARCSTAFAKTAHPKNSESASCRVHVNHHMFDVGEPPLHFVMGRMCDCMCIVKSLRSVDGDFGIHVGFRPEPPGCEHVHAHHTRL